MREVLQELNQEVGSKGSGVVMRDGLVVASEMHPPLNADVVAAVASSAIMSVNAALGELQAAPFAKFVFNASFGKMVFFDSGEAYLVVVLEKQIKTDLAMLSIESAARKIKSLGSLM